MTCLNRPALLILKRAKGNPKTRRRLQIFVDLMACSSSIDSLNLRYVHTNQGSPPRIKGINRHCDEAGTLETLVSCGLCDRSSGPLVEFIATAANRTFRRFERFTIDQDALGKDNW